MPGSKLLLWIWSGLLCSDSSRSIQSGFWFSVDGALKVDVIGDTGTPPCLASTVPSFKGTLLRHLFPSGGSWPDVWSGCSADTGAQYVCISSQAEVCWPAAGPSSGSKAERSFDLCHLVPATPNHLLVQRDNLQALTIPGMISTTMLLQRWCSGFILGRAPYFIAWLQVTLLE